MISLNFYKPLFFVLFAVLLAASAFFAGAWYQSTQGLLPVDKEAVVSKEDAKSVLLDLTPTVTPKISPEKDLVTEEDSQQQAALAIQSAMAAKYNKPVGDVEISISKYEPGFAQGGVQFSGEMGGGWLLAAEVGGEWVIVDDGNGTISCEKIAPYNFPVTIVPECWSETTQELVTR